MDDAWCTVPPVGRAELSHDVEHQSNEPVPQTYTECLQLVGAGRVLATATFYRFFKVTFTNFSNTYRGVESVGGVRGY